MGVNCEGIFEVLYLLLLVGIMRLLFFGEEIFIDCSIRISSEKMLPLHD